MDTNYNLYIISSEEKKGLEKIGKFFIPIVEIEKDDYYEYFSSLIKNNVIITDIRLHKRANIKEIPSHFIEKWGILPQFNGLMHYRSIKNGSLLTLLNHHVLSVDKLSITMVCSLNQYLDYCTRTNLFNLYIDDTISLYR